MLTAKQQRFVEEYLIDFNGAQAAIRAGYSEKTAKEIASENLTKPNIAAAIQAGREKASAKSGIDAEWAMERLKLEAEFHGDGASHSARVSAVGLAMKKLGMLKDQVEHSGQVAQVHVYLPQKDAS